MKINIKVVVLILFLLVFVIFAVEGASRMLHPLKYKEYVVKYSNKYDVDPYLVYSIIKAESSFKADATSNRSARGLMQITDETGKWAAENMGLKEFKPEHLYEPETNISIGCWYLSRLYKQFETSVNLPEDLRKLVLAAYNAGPTRVDTWLKDKSLSSSGNSLDEIPYKETRNYVKRVNNYYMIYKKLYD